MQLSLSYCGTEQICSNEGNRLPIQQCKACVWAPCTKCCRNPGFLIEWKIKSVLLMSTEQVKLCPIEYVFLCHWLESKDFYKRQVPLLRSEDGRTKLHQQTTRLTLLSFPQNSWSRLTVHVFWFSGALRTL